MQVDLICIGSELLTGLVENTNAGYVSRRLWSCGIPVRESRVIHDSAPAIKEALGQSLERSETIIIVGGLGPTDDDLTREAVSEFLDRPLLPDAAWMQRLEKMFAGLGYPMPPANRKQALAIEGSRLLDNPYGTAPGEIIPLEHNRRIILLPGPPVEMAPMLESQVLPYLLARHLTRKWQTKIIRTVGCGESTLEERVSQANLPGGVALSYVARGGEVLLQLKSCGDGAADLLEKAAAVLHDQLGSYIYGVNEETLAGVVSTLFKKRRLTLALAESCSGGLLADTITDIPGSSLFLKGSMVTYSNEAKQAILGVDSMLLQREGAVSAAVAMAMAGGARKALQASFGAAITGVAGPDSDSSGLPPGTVYIAVAGPWGKNSGKLQLPGTRRAIKERAVQALLTMLWRMMHTEMS